MKNPFKQPTLAEKIASDLLHAEFDLLTAEHNVENANATLTSMTLRVIRLRERRDALDKVEHDKAWLNS